MKGAKHILPILTVSIPLGTINTWHQPLKMLKYTSFNSTRYN